MHHIFALFFSLSLFCISCGSATDPLDEATEENPPASIVLENKGKVDTILHLTKEDETSEKNKTSQ